MCFKDIRIEHIVFCIVNKLFIKRLNHKRLTAYIIIMMMMIPPF
jgi:hypothetical protein